MCNAVSMSMRLALDGNLTCTDLLSVIHYLLQFSELNDYELNIVDIKEDSITDDNASSLFLEAVRKPQPVIEFA